MSRHINKQELISKVRELAGLTSDEKSATALIPPRKNASRL